METNALKKALERVATWPKEAQDELVRSLAEIETRYTDVYHVNDEERAALNKSAQDVQRGRFATDQEVDAVFGRFHRAIARLSEFPRMATETDVPDVHVAAVLPYRYLIFYSADHDSISTRNVRHAARERPSDRL